LRLWVEKSALLYEFDTLDREKSALLYNPKKSRVRKVPESDFVVLWRTLSRIKEKVPKSD